MEDTKRISARYIKFTYKNENFGTKFQDDLLQFYIDKTRGRKNIVPDLYVYTANGKTIVLADMHRKINYTNCNKFVYNKQVPDIETLGTSWQTEVDIATGKGEYGLKTKLTSGQVDVSAMCNNITGKKCFNCKEYLCNSYFAEGKINCKSCESAINQEKKKMGLNDAIESIPNGKLIADTIYNIVNMELTSLREQVKEQSMIIHKLSNYCNKIAFKLSINDSDSDSSTPVRREEPLKSGFVLFELGNASKTCAVDNVNKYDINLVFITQKQHSYDELNGQKVIYMTMTENMDETYRYLTNKFKNYADKIRVKIHTFIYAKNDTDIFDMYQKKIDKCLSTLNNTIINIDKGFGIDLGDNKKYKVVSNDILFFMVFTLEQLFK